MVAEEAHSANGHADAATFSPMSTPDSGSGSSPTTRSRREYMKMSPPFSMMRSGERSTSDSAAICAMVPATAANGPTPAIAEASVMRRTISGGGAEQDSGTGTRLYRNSGCSTIHASSSPRSVRTRAAKASLKPSGRGDTAVTRRSVSPITS